MRPIPIKLRNELASNDFYDKCCVCKYIGVQWHHNLIHSGRQVNARFAIMPLCVPCHEQARNKEFREKLNWIMWNRATDEEIISYSKAINYAREKERLNAKFGVEWKPSIN